MYCRSCNYDLRMVADDRCPECGLAFDPRDALTFRKRPRSRRFAALLTGAVFLGWTALLYLLAFCYSAFSSGFVHIPGRAWIAFFIITLPFTLPLTFFSFFWFGIYRYAMAYKS